MNMKRIKTNESHTIHIFVFQSKDEEEEIYSPSQSSKDEAEQEDHNDYDDDEDDTYVQAMLKEVTESPSEPKQTRKKDLEVEFELAVSIFFSLGALMKFLCSDITNGLYSLFLQHATVLITKFDKKTPVRSRPRLFPRSRSPDDIMITLPTRHTVEHEIGIITASPRGRKPVSKTTTTTTTTTATAAASTTMTTNKDIVVIIWEKMYGSYSGCHPNRFRTFFK